MRCERRLCEIELSRHSKRDLQVRLRVPFFVRGRGGVLLPMQTDEARGRRLRNVGAGDGSLGATSKKQMGQGRATWARTTAIGVSADWDVDASLPARGAGNSVEYVGL